MIFAVLSDLWIWGLTAASLDAMAARPESLDAGGGILPDVRGAADPTMPVWDRIKLVVTGLPQGGAKIDI